MTCDSDWVTFLWSALNQLINQHCCWKTLWTRWRMRSFNGGNGCIWHESLLEWMACGGDRRTRGPRESSSEKGKLNYYNRYSLSLTIYHRVDHREEEAIFKSRLLWIVFLFMNVSQKRGFCSRSTKKRETTQKDDPLHTTTTTTGFDDIICSILNQIFCGRIIINIGTRENGSRKMVHFTTGKIEKESRLLDQIQWSFDVWDSLRLDSSTI